MKIYADICKVERRTMENLPKNSVIKLLKFSRVTTNDEASDNYINYLL